MTPGFFKEAYLTPLGHDILNTTLKYGKIGV